MGVIGEGVRMRTIEIRPSAKFGGAWIAVEAPGVEPAFPEPDGKQNESSLGQI